MLFLRDEEFDLLKNLSLKMGLGPESIKLKNSEANDKSKKAKKKKDGEGEEEEVGCWVKFNFLESCMSSRSKVDHSMSGTTNTNNYGIFFFLPFPFLFLINKYIYARIEEGLSWFYSSYFSMYLLHFL